MKESEHDQLLVFQGFLCAVCRQADEASSGLTVDYDGQSGDVRGLLCDACADLLGRAGSIARLRSAVRYLAFSPYAAMKEGWEAWYEDE